MKVLCVYEVVGSLTKNKWYNLITEDDGYLIKNDGGYEEWYPIVFFKTQYRVREQKLKELGL